MREAMHDMFSHLAGELDRFDRLLRDSGSATATLVQWVGVSADGSSAMLHAHIASGAAPPPSADRCARLAAPTHDIFYRRVRLVHEGRILSDAQNWYVASRLTPEMMYALETSTIPFGKLIEPLCPTRETLSSERLWSPEESPKKLPPCLLRHHALVRSGAGAPICEVSEMYTRNILRYSLPSASR